MHITWFPRFPNSPLCSACDHWKLGFFFPKMTADFSDFQDFKIQNSWNLWRSLKSLKFGQIWGDKYLMCKKNDFSWCQTLRPHMGMTWHCWKVWLKYHNPFILESACNQPPWHCFCHYVKRSSFLGKGKRGGGGVGVCSAMPCST
jgi:hypothetical protein